MPTLRELVATIRQREGVDAAIILGRDGLVIEGPLGCPEAPKMETYGANGITWAGKAGEGCRATNNVVYGNVHCGLKEMGHEAHKLHRTVHRPWGTYRPIHSGHRVQVKHITVKPGGKLSMQMHHHRAEHWVVVQGTARVVRGEEELILTEDQSTYIPLGTAHRLENPGKIPLHLIEVQSGSYLGEDDIIRFDDHYGRD